MNTETRTEQAVVAAAAAPQDHFVTVPETVLPAFIVGGVVTRPSITVPAFQVAQYLASAREDGTLVITPDGAPLVDVSYHEMRKLCAAAGFSMITETQALSLALNLFMEERNWETGAVGEGSMFKGLHLDLDDVDEPYPFTYRSADARERREFYLADGSMVLDAAGNAYTFVFDDIQGDERGLVAHAFEADSPSIATAPYASMEKGMGWRPGAGSDWSGRALIRGGFWFSSDSAGVFVLGNGWADSGYDDVGVRCTKPIGL